MVLNMERNFILYPGIAALLVCAMSALNGVSPNLEAPLEVFSPAGPIANDRFNRDPSNRKRSHEHDSTPPVQGIGSHRLIYPYP